MASASVASSAIGTNDNKFSTCDITGSHAFRSNMTASRGEGLVVFYQSYGSATNGKYYWQLVARTNE